MAAECIITGCALILSRNNDWISGDLFTVGGSYVFNAVGEPNYDGRPFYDKRVTLRNDHYFVRRNVYVFSKLDADLNEEARKYISGEDA